MRPKLYLESTIPSYLVARPSQAVVVAGQQLTTHQWWAKRLKDFDIYVSQVVLEEISAGDEEMARQRLELVKSFAGLRLTDEVNVLTKALLRRGPLPPKAARDAAHIAVATVHGMHFLLTWNSAILIMAMSAQIRNPKSETRRKSEIRRPIPPAHPLTQRRRDSQRFAESSLALRFSAFLCVSALSPVPESETRSPSLPLINTQLQLGEPRPRCGPTVSTVSPDFCP